MIFQQKVESYHRFHQKVCLSGFYPIHTDFFCVHCFMFILFFITTAFNCQYSSFSVLSSEKNGFSTVTLHFLLRALPRLFTGVRKPVLVMVLVVYGRIHL